MSDAASSATCPALMYGSNTALMTQRTVWCIQGLVVLMHRPSSDMYVFFWIIEYYILEMFWRHCIGLLRNRFFLCDLVINLLSKQVSQYTHLWVVGYIMDDNFQLRTMILWFIFMCLQPVDHYQQLWTIRWTDDINHIVKTHFLNPSRLSHSNVTSRHSICLFTKITPFALRRSAHQSLPSLYLSQNQPMTTQCPL